MEPTDSQDQGIGICWGKDKVSQKNPPCCALHRVWGKHLREIGEDYRVLFTTFLGDDEFRTQMNFATSASISYHQGVKPVVQTTVSTVSPLRRSNHTL